MRKFFATLLALVMVLSLMVPTAWAAEGDVTILYTNDVHTYINQEVKLEDESKVPGIQYSWIAALKDSLGENVLAEVFQKGFRVGEKIIRFAMVRVAN